jgi:hypothetical protein
MFIFPAIKHYKELWRVENRVRSERLKSVRANPYQNSMGEDSLKSTLEMEDHVPEAEYINPIKLCLIRDDLHMGAHLCSKGHLLTPALKEIRRTRAKCLLQWHAKNGHENILFTKLFGSKSGHSVSFSF